MPDSTNCGPLNSSNPLNKGVNRYIDEFGNCVYSGRGAAKPNDEKPEKDLKDMTLEELLDVNCDDYATNANVQTSDAGTAEVGVDGSLRETWEALVEDELLNKVIRRHGNEVQTLRLSEAQVLNEDYRVIYFGMKKCSEWMIGHDRSKAIDVNRPVPTEVRADIQSMRNYWSQINQRKREIKEQRESLRNPPVPPIV